MSNRDRYLCMKCQWQGHEEEIIKELAHHETEYEPEEWAWFCPNCHKMDDLEEIEEIYCRTCEDEIVQHEGDQCPECELELLLERVNEARHS